MARRRRQPRVIATARKEVRATRKAVLGPTEAISSTTSVARQVGAAEAYSAAAQSAALVTETGAAYLRNITMIGQAAMAAAVVNMLKEPPVSVVQYTPVVEAIGKVITSAVSSFTEISTAAGKVVQEFPSS